MSNNSEYVWLYVEIDELIDMEEYTLERTDRGFYYDRARYDALSNGFTKSSADHIK